MDLLKRMFDERMAAIRDYERERIEMQLACEAVVEVCGMYCEQLPIEVREALHKVPGVKKWHRCGEVQ